MVIFDDQGKNYSRTFESKEIFLLTKNKKDIDDFSLVFKKLGIQCKRFDITNISNNESKGRILFISDNMIRNLEYKTYTEHVLPHHFVYSYAEKLDQEVSDGIEGHIQLPLTNEDIQTIIAVSRLKSLYEQKIKKISVDTKRAHTMATISKYTNSMIHDLNNYSTICITALDGIKIINEKKYKDQKFDILLSKGTKGMQKIDQVIKKYEKLLKGSEDNEFKKLSLKSLVHESVDLVQKEIDSHGIEVRFNLEKDLLVECLEIKFIQVLFNILFNAIEAISDEKEKWIEINVKIVKDKLTILISDSGNGVDESNRYQIFEAGFTTKQNSQGLGLSFSNEVLSEMGMELLYIEAKNTVFGISIPASRFSSVLIKN